MQEILVFSKEKKQKIFFDETRIKIVDVIKGEKVNISIRQAVAESIHQFVYSRFFPTSAALGYRKTEGCCQPHPSCLTMTKMQKNAKTNTKQIEMRKTNTALVS